MHDDAIRNCIETNKNIEGAICMHRTHKLINKMVTCLGIFFFLDGLVFFVMPAPTNETNTTQRSK